MSTTKKLALMIAALYFSSFAQARELEVCHGRRDRDHQWHDLHREKHQR